MKANCYWLVKEEPESCAWSEFVAEGVTAWTGVRNYQARNNLRRMKPGDRVLYYHSGKERQVMGVAQVSRAAYPDPTAETGDWSAVDLVPLSSLPRPVPLGVIREDAALAEAPLLRQTRLSVMPLTKEQFARILTLGGARKSA